MVSEMIMKSRVDGLDISVMVVTPDSEPKAVIQIAHGVCGCKERFVPFMIYMAQNGIACIAGDHRGHGKSVRSFQDLGYMYKGGYRALVDDMRMITEWAHNAFPARPLYLLGHSMGSMASRVYAKYDDSSIDGLILVASPSKEPFAALARLATGFLCAVGLSHHRMNFSQSYTSRKYNRKFASEGEQAWVCSDLVSRRVFIDNPVCNFTLTANGVYNMLSLMAETYRPSKWFVSKPDMPIFFISGAEDPLMRGEKMFHRSVQNICNRGYTNVTSAIYPSMRHEVLNEIGKENAWNDILDFISQNSND